MTSKRVIKIPFLSVPPIKLIIIMIMIIIILIINNNIIGMYIEIFMFQFIDSCLHLLC